MAEQFAFDSVAFLQLLNQLRRRFDEVVSHAPLSFEQIDGDLVQPQCAHKHTERGEKNSERNIDTVALVEEPKAIFERIDARVAELTEELFSTTHWAWMICVASRGLDSRFIDDARAFLSYCSSMVRKFGMGAWLYDLLNDATMSMLLHRPSEHMPVVQTPYESIVDVIRRRHRTVDQRFGTVREREQCIRDHTRHAHALAAYCTLKWGTAGTHRSTMAQLLLNEPGLGMCMLREDKTVRDLGACPDMRFRRVIKYVRQLRVQADFEYAKDALHSDDMPNVESHAPEVQDMDKRYLYDARKLVEAYRALWPRHTRSTKTVLGEIEERNALPTQPLWENTVYLRDLAMSLMGSSMASKLIGGFERRDMEDFEKGVRLLKAMCSRVQELGLPFLPILVIEQLHQSMMEIAHEDFPSIEIPDYEQLDCEHDDEHELDVSEYSGDAVEDMAAMVLQRVFPEEDEANANMAMALLRVRMGDYAQVVMELFGDDEEGLDDDSVDDFPDSGGRGAADFDVIA